MTKQWMTILPKSLKDLHVSKFRIYGSVLKEVTAHVQKYLGAYFTSDRLENVDMKRKLCSVYTRGNIFVTKI